MHLLYNDSSACSAVAVLPNAYSLEASKDNTETATQPLCRSTAEQSFSDYGVHCRTQRRQTSSAPSPPTNRMSFGDWKIREKLSGIVLCRDAYHSCTQSIIRQWHNHMNSCSRNGMVFGVRCKEFIFVSK